MLIESRDQKQKNVQEISRLYVFDIKLLDRIYLGKRHELCPPLFNPYPLIRQLNQCSQDKHDVNFSLDQLFVVLFRVDSNGHSELY